MTSPSIGLVEASRAGVVVDDLYMGTRDYWKDVVVERNALNNLGERYLGQVMCPRTRGDQ